MVSTEVFKISLNFLLIFVVYQGIDSFIFKRSISASFLCPLATFFGTRLVLKSNHWIISAIIIAINEIVTISLINTYYHPEGNAFNFLNFIFMAVLAIVSFSQINHRMIKELKSSKIMDFIISHIIELFTILRIFYFYTKPEILNRFKVQDSIKDIDFNNEAFHFFVELLIINFPVSIILKSLTSKSKKESYLKILSNIYIFHIIIVFLVYINYNQHILDFVYKSLNQYVPQPHNVHLYNMVSEKADHRFIAGLIVAAGFLF